MRFLHAADIHLDSPLRRLAVYDEAPVDELRQATRRAFENLIDLAVDTPVDFLLIAGDLYDGDWQDYNTGLYFVAQMRRLREAGIPAYIVAGNHDAASKITRVLRLPGNVHLFSAEKPETLRVPETDAAVHGQSFATPAVQQDLSAAYPPPLPGCFNIGLLHTCAGGREGHAPYAPCTLNGLLAKGYDYWALGHVHRREALHDDPPVMFPGNLQGRHARETGRKGCLQVDVEPDGTCTCQFQPLDVLCWETVRVNADDTGDGYETVDRFSDGLQRRLRRHPGLPLAVRVVVEGSGKAFEQLLSQPERWENEIRAAALDGGEGLVWVEKVVLQALAPPMEKTPPHLSDTAVGELLGLLEELPDDAEGLERLARDLRDLERKLPHELQEDPDRIPLDDPRHLSELLNGIRPLLLQRLAGNGESP
ncbi:MAG: DNA repair exonuclease [Desulfobacteraceae bacterium]|nr:DNA repair exonuclease [Desulfobacteraceae bacterium]